MKSRKQSRITLILDEESNNVINENFFADMQTNQKNDDNDMTLLSHKRQKISDNVFAHVDAQQDDSDDEIIFRASDNSD